MQAGVLNEIWPEPANGGTVIVMLLDVTDVGASVGVVFRSSSLFCAPRSKFVPVRTVEPATATICGVKELMVGAPALVSTRKESVLVGEPPGELTLIVPVVAAAGTDTTRDVADAELTLAVVPLNLTLSWPGSELKLDPEMV